MSPTGAIAEPALPLLNDEQLRAFIVDGFLTVDCGLPPAQHARIRSDLEWMIDHGPNQGNNVLPLVPALERVIASPAVRGALTSLLGPDYVLAPHRYAHDNAPDARRTSLRGAYQPGFGTPDPWVHQDSHSPLARPRHHQLWHAMVMYYPQETSEAMGPTRLVPGSQWQAAVMPGDERRALPATGGAGTCIVTHFDLVHGRSANVEESTRFMIKFVASRVRAPTAPTWPSVQERWQAPAARGGAWRLDAAWQHHWRWMRGDGPARSRTAANIDDLIAAFDRNEPERIEAIYAAASLGVGAVPALSDRLRAPPRRCWNEDAVVMEDAAYALAALGAPAVPELRRLARHDVAWVRINAAFALGEIAAAARDALPELVALLQDPAHAVVRTALDAIGQVGGVDREQLLACSRLLDEPPPSWREPLLRGWSGVDQVRANLALASLRLGVGTRSPVIEDVLVRCLDEQGGYASGYAIEGLLRLGTRSGMERALRYLVPRRWDAVLRTGQRTY